MNLGTQSRNPPAGRSNTFRQRRAYRRGMSGAATTPGLSAAYPLVAGNRWRLTSQPIRRHHGMRSSDWGRTLSVSGLAARQSGDTVGSVRNVAVATLTKSLADELGPAGLNVAVVRPGFTRTERKAALVAARAAAHGVAPQVIEDEVAAANAIGHLVDASEVADLVTFLCSPRSCFLTCPLKVYQRFVC